MNLRTITAGGAALLALTFAPAAQATPPALPDGSAVCNTASQNWQGGTLDVASPASVGLMLTRGMYAASRMRR